MKFLLLFSLLSLPFLVVAEDDSTADGAIKMMDMKNAEISTMPSSEGNAAISPEQAENLKKQIETLKENQRKSNDALEELGKEK